MCGNCRRSPSINNASYRYASASDGATPLFCTRYVLDCYPVQATMPVPLAAMQLQPPEGTEWMTETDRGAWGGDLDKDGKKLEPNPRVDECGDIVQSDSRHYGLLCRSRRGLQQARPLRYLAFFHKQECCAASNLGPGSEANDMICSAKLIRLVITTGRNQP